MPENWIHFIDAHFIQLWFGCLGWVVVAFTFKYFWHRSKGRFPEDPPASSIIFKESFASGRSHKSWRTRLGGASNCLKVMITVDRLIVRPFFPFLILGPEIDMVHSIPLASIEAVDRRTGVFQKGFKIRFRLQNGEMREIDLVSRKPIELETALSTATHQKK